MEEIMKKTYKCHKCGEKNEFDTNSGIMELREYVNKGPDVYIDKCKYCGEKNRIEIERKSNE